MNITIRRKLSIYPSLTAAFLVLAVAMAFVLHLFTYTDKLALYVAILLAAVMAYAFSKPVSGRIAAPRYTLLWVMAFLVIIFSYLFTYRAKVVMVDLIVLICGFVLVVFCSSNCRDYSAVLSFIKIVALVFTAGVLIQRFLPAVYKAALRIFPSALSAKITAYKNNVVSYRGFTTNVGFTANYILAGVLAVICEHSRRKWNLRSVLYIAVSALALLFTGKRGPILFFVVAFAFCSLITIKGGKKAKLLIGLLIGFAAAVVLFFALEDVLAGIPIFKQVIKTINNALAGNDITSGRSKLYVWAIQLFSEHPLKGVGWGNYRNTLAGNVTWRASLDTHNVYLQLLCETGIFGFLIFVTLFIAGWVMAKKAYMSCIAEQEENLRAWKPALLFSFVFQTYFLLYCLTGNPLYDQFYQIMYLFSCSIPVAYGISKNRQAVRPDGMTWPNSEAEVSDLRGKA